MTATRSALAAALCGSLLLAFAAPVAGATPGGQGLTTLPEQGITSVSCTDSSITLGSVRLPRGGGAANFVAGGRVYVTLSISVTGTGTGPGGTFPVSFQKTYGARTGLSTRITCTFTQSFVDAGVTFNVTGTITLARVQ